MTGPGQSIDLVTVQLRSRGGSSREACPGPIPGPIPGERRSCADRDQETDHRGDFPDLLNGAGHIAGLSADQARGRGGCSAAPTTAGRTTSGACPREARRSILRAAKTAARRGESRGETERPPGRLPDRVGRPSSRAGGSIVRASGRRARHVAATSTTARGPGRVSRSARVARPRPARRRRARAPNAPKEPMRLSFMISRRRSGVEPPPNPSAVSARPSSWNAPVTRVMARDRRAPPRAKAPSPSI